MFKSSDGMPVVQFHYSRHSVSLTESKSHPQSFHNFKPFIIQDGTHLERKISAPPATVRVQRLKLTTSQNCNAGGDNKGLRWFDATCFVEEISNVLNNTAAKLKRHI